MAVDLGSKRVGLAITDDGGRIALPFMTLSKERKRSDRIRRILRLGEQNGVTQYVIGLPLRMNGDEGPEAGAAREFAIQMQSNTQHKVELHDETCTTTEAQEKLTESGVPQERQKEMIDQVAAVLILQSWMTRQEQQR